MKKLSSIKNVPENRFLVTMDISSFYTSTVLDYQFCYDFVLLTIFSTYGLVTKIRWFISFLSRNITVNPRT